MRRQRINVNFGESFPESTAERHKADRAALRLSCVVCFEALAGVFASAGAIIATIYPRNG